MEGSKKRLGNRKRVTQRKEGKGEEQAEVSKIHILI